MKKFGTWANKFWQGLPKVHYACPETLLQEIKNTGKKNCLLVPLVPWGKICRTLSKRFPKFMSDKIAVCFSELHSTCPGDVFQEKNFWKWWFYCISSALTEQIWSFGGKFLWRLTNNLLYGFRNRNLGIQWNKLRSFFGKSYGFSIFSVLWPKYFWFLGKKPSPRGVKTAFGESRWRLWGLFLKKKLIFCNFCTLSGKFSGLFAKTFRAWFSKHQFMCPGKHFAKISYRTDGIFVFSFFQQKRLVVRAKHFGTLAKTFRTLVKKLWEGFQNRNLHV